MFVSSMLGYHSVDALVPALGSQRDTTNDESVAAQEDNGMAMAATGAFEAETIIDPNQNHVLHLQVHIPSMLKDAQSLQQGNDPQVVERVLTSKGMHAHEHLIYLENNPTRQSEAKQFGAQLAQLASLTDQLRQQLEEQAHNAPPPPDQPNPDMVKVQGNLELKAKKQDGDAALKARGQDMKYQLDLRKLQLDTGLKGAQTASTIAIQDAKGAASIRQSRVKTAAKVNGSAN